MTNAMLFTGFKLRTPTGYLSEGEQEALIIYVLARAAAQPTIAHEVQLVLDGQRDARDLSASTLGALRHLAGDFMAAGKPRNYLGSIFAALPRVQLAG